MRHSNWMAQRAEGLGTEKPNQVLSNSGHNIHEDVGNG